MYNLPAHIVPIIAGIVAYILQSDVANKSDIIINFVDGMPVRDSLSTPVIQQPRYEPPVEEKVELCPYEGSLAHYYDEQDLIEKTLSGYERVEFLDLIMQMDGFLCTCEPWGGYDAQKAMILIMTVINCGYGYNSAFPRNPFLLGAILDEGLDVLMGAVKSAARNAEQQSQALRTMRGLAEFFKKERVLERAKL